MFNFLKIFNDFKEKVELIQYNIKLLRYHIKEPDPGTLWYSWIYSRYCYLGKAWIYFICVLITFFIFIIYRFIKQHESLVVFIYIFWFFSSLFYIEFIRV
jgi:hypothetical protein